MYGLISNRGANVPGMPKDFSIEPGTVSLEGLPVVAEADVEEFLGDAGKAEIGAPILSLEKALAIAVINSREYQGQKESLYLQALGFSETRQRYGPIFSGDARAGYAVRNRATAKRSTRAQLAQTAPELIAAIGTLTGSPAALMNAYADVLEAAAEVTGANAPTEAFEQERSFSSGVSFNVGVLMKGGARIAAGLTTNFLRFLTGNSSVSASSALLASIEQPLLGANRRSAAETFTQAERSLLYSLRSFTRFRQQFSIEVASAYYGVLLSRHTARNNWLGYQSFQKLLERSEAEAEAGLITQTALGRTRQEELQTKNNWIRSIQAYQDALDAFKIRLALSTDAKVVLDAKELDRLMERGPMPPPSFSLEDAIQVAFTARLDYYTEKDQVDDAGRRLELAKDALLPDIDIVLDATLDSKPGDSFRAPDPKRYSWNAGIGLNPRLNRKEVRNQYRTAEIQYDAAKRGLDEFEDRTKLEVRQAWRELEQARLSYDIQMNSVQLGDRRVLEQELLLEAGRGEALDRIDAQNALIAARNSVSQALVSHTTESLRLWLSMGLLYIKDNGQWEDITDASQLRKTAASS